LLVATVAVPPSLGTWRATGDQRRRSRSLARKNATPAVEALIAPLEGIVDADHLCLPIAANGVAVARARRGGRCLAQPADSVAGAGCGGRRWVTPIARELPVTISNVTSVD